MNLFRLREKLISKIADMTTKYLKLKSPVVIGRAACVGKDVLARTRFSNLPLLNFQKARADLFLDLLADRMGDFTLVSDDDFVRKDVVPLVRALSTLKTDLQSAKRVKLVLVDSFSELTDQLFSKDEGKVRFCCHYSDLNHSSPSRIIQSEGLVPLEGLENLYRQFFGSLRSRFPNTPIAFVQYSSRYDQRSVFKERREEIRRIAKNHSVQDSLFINIDLDEVLYEPNEHDTYPYHYSENTLSRMAAILDDFLTGSGREK